MAEDVDQLRFERPPVREVRLAFFFGTIGRFRASYVGALYDRWRDQYPEAMEDAPYQFLNRDESDYEFLTDEGAWPVPFTTYSDPAAQQSISFQADRFSITWQFSPDGANYPGFANLSARLVARFNEFNELLQASPAGSAQITNTECIYINHIQDVSPRRYARGVLTAWASDSEQDAADLTSEGLVLSRHLHVAGDPNDAVWVSVAPISEDDEDKPEGTELTIRVLHTVTSSEARWEDELTVCHDIATQQFLANTSPEMRDQWGSL